MSAQQLEHGGGFLHILRLAEDAIPSTTAVSAPMMSCSGVHGASPSLPSQRPASARNLPALRPPVGLRPRPKRKTLNIQLPSDSSSLRRGELDASRIRVRLSRIKF